MIAVDEPAYWSKGGSAPRTMLEVIPPHTQALAEKIWSALIFCSDLSLHKNSSATAPALSLSLVFTLLTTKNSIIAIFLLQA